MPTSLGKDLVCLNSTVNQVYIYATQMLEVNFRVEAGSPYLTFAFSAEALSFLSPSILPKNILTKK